MVQPQANRLERADASDFEDWRMRSERLMATPEKALRPASSTPRKWHTRSTGCLWPVTTCCLAVWCPCVLFSRIHHRTRKDRTMSDFKIVNTTCILWCGAATLGLQWIPQLMQRADLRQKYNIQGDWMSDLFCAFCCNCCDMIQQEKESIFREEELPLSAAQYSNNEQMQYSTQFPRTPEQHGVHLLHPEPSMQTMSSQRSMDSYPASKGTPHRYSDDI
ncbi:hypothetical protein EV356DRAFT_563295 [Viridothelium virens]|uniref:PLAC8-domain-containing protein n=1 Tax=Viridothelium virens TaxID=1048519 RepID=A0A6A6HM46_VIRVR|nr:hypothetical protein EV356DRAFT_563295 [Viridothelium virens]